MLLEPEGSPECSWHLFLDGVVDERGGFPPAETAGVRKMEEPSLPLETLPSPVMAEERKEELEETLNVVVSFENSSSNDLALEVKKLLGFVKSRVRDCATVGLGW